MPNQGEDRSGSATTEWAFENREDRRLALPDGERAVVEFDYPNPHGPRRTLPLLDISATGVAFTVSRSLRGLERGSNLTDVVLRVGQCEVEGELLLSHVTPLNDDGSMCGGRFFPMTQADQLKLAKLLTAMNAVG